MATTPRSGSNLLCQRLFERAQLQVPKEFLNIEFLQKWGVIDHEAKFLIPSLDVLLDRAKYDRRDTAFPICIKTMYTQFDLARTLPGVSEGLRAETVILLLRRDIVAQAVSLYIAEHTGRWTSYGRPRSDKSAPPYDFEAIEARIRRIDHHVALWRQTFEENHIDHRVVYYEQLMDDPDELLGHLMHVWQLKPRARPARHSNPHERQTTALNADFIERYRLDRGNDRANGGTDG
jgi:LPS sulfotransferase NodH